uniref:TauD/TfdA-like domain-containing protein n=1 Tax=Scylla olivacea TaxID=85551 RepID=A0A0P4W1B5_SCYOL
MQQTNFMFLYTEDHLIATEGVTINFFQYGVAVLRGVPQEKNKIIEVVNRFAYVKETQYGRTFDVINKPVEGAHLAYTGVALAHHTDMNYREKSPGMQLLHCLKVLILLITIK